MFKPQPVLKKYYDALEEGKFLALKCPECGNYEWPPLPTCDKCFNMDMEWAEISGEAVIEDIWAVQKHFAMPFHQKFLPFYGCLGKLKEGREFHGLLFGITKENEAEMRKKLPNLKAKAITVKLDEGYSVSAWQVAE